MLIVKRNKYGRGVYTTAPLEKGQLIIVNHLLIISPKDRKGSPTLRRYDFEFFDEKLGESGIALGIASLMNHSIKKANADFETTYYDKDLPIVFVTTTKKIKAGSEILVNYGYDPTEVE